MIKLAKLNNAPEIFYSIQGEGKSLGKPSIFIRLSLCNLYCVWCDTDYTWNWEGTDFIHSKDKNSSYKKFIKEDCLIQIPNSAIIEELKKYNCNNVVVTGGEPMVQLKELTLLLKELKESKNSYYIEIETNGTLKPTGSIDALIDQYNVSVKLSNSKVKIEERYVEDAVLFFAGSDKSNFKFVIDSPDDLNETVELQTKYKIDSAKIYLMPQGTNPSQLNEKQQWLVEQCKKYGFNYTDRLHIRIYGNKRGV